MLIKTQGKYGMIINSMIDVYYIYIIYRVGDFNGKQHG